MAKFVIKLVARCLIQKCLKSCILVSAYLNRSHRITKAIYILLSSIDYTKKNQVLKI